MKRRFDLPAFAVALMLATLAAPGLRGSARAQASQRDIDALSKASLIYIATVRRDGNQSKNTPVWFTTTPDHLALIETPPDSWKAKRIRHHHEVFDNGEMREDLTSLWNQHEPGVRPLRRVISVD